MAYDGQLVSRVRDALAGQSGLTEQKMFGGLTFLVRGRMAVSVTGRGGLMLHVDPAEYAALLADPLAEPIVMRGRELSGWLHVEPAKMDDTTFAAWVQRGVDYARSQPPR